MAEMEGIADVEIEELGDSMQSELRNYLALDILDNSGITEFCSIPRIHDHIRLIDKNSYEPIVLSIGPYHNGSAAFSSLDREKWNCLEYILTLNCKKGLKDYLTIIKRLEKRARICYSGDIKMNKRKFLQTLLLDGCFVLVSLGGLNEFIRFGPEGDTASPSHSKVPTGDPTTSGHSEVTGSNEILDEYEDNAQQMGGRWYDIFVVHDLLLLENQIPFFVVEGIYEVSISNMPAPTTTITTSVNLYVEKFLPCYPKAIGESNRPHDFDHLLHLCHMYFRASPNHDSQHDHTAQHRIDQFLQLGWYFLSLFCKQQAAKLGSSQDGHSPNRWRRATQYHEAGIEFRMRTYCEHNPHSLLDIKLIDSVLEIPFFPVDESVNAVFRNFIALEQTCPQVGNDVTAYIVFVAQLLSMPEDVALLARKGVVAHHMRTDREVSQLFTKLTKGVVFDFYGNYYLKHLCSALEVHYQSRLHRWIAWLRHNQFGNPWLAVAGLAGVIVLFCTVAQTVLTVLSYVRPK